MPEVCGEGKQDPEGLLPRNSRACKEPVRTEKRESGYSRNCYLVSHMQMTSRRTISPGVSAYSYGIAKHPVNSQWAKECQEVREMK